jgi:flagellar hook-associated protein 3 FlgL
VLNRIGDFAQSQRITGSLLSAQSRSRDIQAQLSSGKVGDRFQSIATSTERLLGAKDALQQARQYAANNDIVIGRLQVMESAVGSIFDLASEMRTSLVQRLSDASAQPGVAATTAELLLEQVVSGLNTDLDGRFLFAGSRTDAAPVVLDQAFAGFGGPDDTYYQGDQIEVTFRADADVSLTYGMTADRQGFRDLVGALRTVIDADAIDDRAMLESALDLINQALPRLGDYRAELGARQARLEDINLIHSNADVYLQRQISDIEDVDLAEAVTRMTQDQILVESAMATIGRLSQLSLVDFLR